MTTESERVGAVELILGEERPVARIRLRARQSGVPVVRQFVTGMSEALRLDGHATENLKLAVTEAVTNVVVHAYEGQEGDVDVELHPDDGDLTLVVRDYGIGPPTREQVEGEEAGYGLALIHTVCDRVDLRGTGGGGTELEMTLTGVARGGEPPDGINFPVLHRVVAMMAASTGFSMARLSDAVLVAETLAAHTPQHSVDGAMSVAVEDGPRDVLLRVGPLRRGGGDSLLADSSLPAFGPVLESLADEVGVHNGEAGEYLLVRLSVRV